MMRIEFSRYIEDDLQEIAEWIAEDNPHRAVSFIREVRDAIRKIGEGPLLYQLRPEIGEDARMAVVGRYAILFWVGDEMVRIERVVFGGRELSPLFQ